MGGFVLSKTEKMTAISVLRPLLVHLRNCGVDLWPFLYELGISTATMANSHARIPQSCGCGRGAVRWS